MFDTFLLRQRQSGAHRAAQLPLRIRFMELGAVDVHDIGCLHVSGGGDYRLTHGQSANTIQLLLHRLPPRWAMAPPYPEPSLRSSVMSNLEGLPVILVSGIQEKLTADFHAFIDRFKHYRADAYLDKPVDPAHLFATIENVLARRRH